ncbi:helix-turn-helix transcriptional regulator [Corynebacterium flavescens]|uniref:helix-turn-helix transcriptional regulator n=1 Tax=Corynebacterium flavescens TaxID=28028 RepID=UPI003FD1CB5F
MVKAEEPASTPRSEAVERLTNLAFSLLGAAGSGGSPDRSAAWIRLNVEGYQERSNEAFAKLISRDVATLQRAGVPIVHSSGEDGVMYRLNDEDYQLPPVSFSPEEAMVLGLAGGIGQPGGLSDFSLSGWTKIAASGASRDLSGAPAYTANNDITRVSADIVTAILTAVRAGLRIVFDYRPTPASTPQRRSMDPWGLVNHYSRVYLVGWDVDKQATRVFRILRVSNVRRSRDSSTHLQPAAPLQELVVKALQRGDSVDAVVRVPAGRAQEISQAGEQMEGGLVRLRGVDRDWLVRTAAGYAPEVIVVSPEEIRAEIVALLSGESTRRQGPVTAVSAQPAEASEPAEATDPVEASPRKKGKK